MKRMLDTNLALLFLLILQGCNSIYFYETQKYSLTVEGRPDASSPASFNLGIKHRVAAVVPEKGNLTDFCKCPEKVNGADVGQGNSEAVSLISYFNFHKKNDSTGYFDDPLLVETALISGSAAAMLGKSNGGQDKAGEILNILSSANTLTGSDFVSIKNLINVIKKDARKGNETAKKILTELNVVNKELLDDEYPVTTYIVDGSVSPRNLKDVNKEKVKIQYSKNIIGLYEYLGELKKSIDSIQTILKKPNLNMVLGNPANNEITIRGLKAEFEKTREIMNSAYSKLRNESGYNNATKYYVKNHLGLELN